MKNLLIATSALALLSACAPTETVDTSAPKTTAQQTSGEATFTPQEVKTTVSYTHLTLPTKA